MKLHTFAVILAIESAAVVICKADFWVDYRLDANDIKTFFTDVLRRETDRLTQLEKELKAEFPVCERKINKTYDDCQECTKVKCRNPPPANPSLLEGALMALTNPAAAVKKPLAAAGKTMSNLASGAINFLGANVGSFFKGFGRGLFNFGFFGGRSGITSGIGNLFKKPVNRVKNVANSAGRGVVNAGRSISRGVSSIFGRRRRRSLSAEEKQCYDKCPSCTAFTLARQQDRVKHVCGEALINKNTTMYQIAQRVISLSGSVDAGDIVLVKFSFGQLNHATGVSTRNRVIGRIEGQSFEYHTNLALSVSGPRAEQKRLSISLLNEFERKWNVELNKKYKF